MTDFRRTETNKVFSSKLVLYHRYKPGKILTVIPEFFYDFFPCAVFSYNKRIPPFRRTAYVDCTRRYSGTLIILLTNMDIHTNISILIRRIQQLAEVDGVHCQMIATAFTSQTCNMCGFVHKLNRKGDVCL
ncbi:MAG: hypothetical protein DDT19_00542 [Syntrophomonadaceae bacterium]|nr:hypothetical protein [Bacillota bacterium]